MPAVFLYSSSGYLCPQYSCWSSYHFCVCVYIYNPVAIVALSIVCVPSLSCSLLFPTLSSFVFVFLAFLNHHHVATTSFFSLLLSLSNLSYWPSKIPLMSSTVRFVIDIECRTEKRDVKRKVAPTSVARNQRPVRIVRRAHFAVHQRERFPSYRPKPRQPTG